MPADRPLLGITLITGFCAIAPSADAIAKLLGEAIPLLQLLAVRFGAQAALLLPILWVTGGSLTMSRRALELTLLRTLLHIAGLGAMFTALRFLPLADAVAMAFVMPFFMLLLGGLVLGEEVGWHRMLACLAGFAGTLLVLQPSLTEVGLPALLPLAVALIFALFMMVSRQLARDNDPFALQAVSGMMAMAILGPLALLMQDSGYFAFEMVRPSGREWALLAGIGVLGTLGHVLMTWALRFAPAATLAPIQYLEIPLATATGWVVFSDFPNALATVGIVVTIFAGLYVVMVERALPRHAPSTT